MTPDSRFDWFTSRQWRALAIFAGLFAFVAVAGSAVDRTDYHILIHASPYLGSWDPIWTWWTLLPVGALAVAIWSVRFTGSWKFSKAVIWWYLIALGFGLALSRVEGPFGWTKSMFHPYEYYRSVELIHGTGDFLRHFISKVNTYSLHVQGHPPLYVLCMYWLASVGLPGRGWAAAMTITVAYSAVPAAAIAVRNLTDSTTAQRLLPLLAIAPTAVWLVTSSDGFYAGVLSWAICATVVAVRRSSRTIGFIGGLIFGAALYLSFGMTVPIIVVCAILAYRRAWQVLVPLIAGIGIVAAVFFVAGYSWFAGLAEIRRIYDIITSPYRPYWWFVFANVVAIGTVIGPVPWMGLVELRDRRVRPLLLGAAACIGIADLSGLALGETERIFLPFGTWLMVGALGMAISVRHTRRALALQGTLAIVLGVMIRTVF